MANDTADARHSTVQAGKGKRSAEIVERHDGAGPVEGRCVQTVDRPGDARQIERLVHAILNAEVREVDRCLLSPNGGPIAVGKGHVGERDQSVRGVDDHASVSAVLEAAVSDLDFGLASRFNDHKRVAGGTCDEDTVNQNLTKSRDRQSGRGLNHLRPCKVHHGTGGIAESQTAPSGPVPG